MLYIDYHPYTHKIYGLWLLLLVFACNDRIKLHIIVFRIYIVGILIDIVWHVVAN